MSTAKLLWIKSSGFNSFLRNVCVLDGVSDPKTIHTSLTGESVSVCVCVCMCVCAMCVCVCAVCAL